MTTIAQKNGKSDSDNSREFPAVEIRMLGRFIVRRAGVRVAPREFGGLQARRLLRLLALRPGTLLSKDAAAEALWPQRQPADPAGNVEVLISRIRSALGDRSLVETGPAGYMLVIDERIWIDTEALLADTARGRGALATDPATALTAFTQALTVWGGEPLTEDAYADWAQDPRNRLCDTYLQALEGAATAALAVGDPVTAAQWARLACERQPLREASTLLLVRALALGGDRAAALGAFDEFRARLADELGVDPSTAALALRQQVLLDQITRPAEADADRALRQRISDLEPTRTDLLALIAIAGRPVSSALLTSIVGGDLRAALDDVESLRRTGLVSAATDHALAHPHDSGGWVLAGPEVAGVLDSVLDAGRRARLHLLLAAELRRRGGDLAEIAAHLAAAGDVSQAATAYAAAAEDRLRRIADDAALRCAEAGLALPVGGRQRAALLTVRAEVRRRRGALEAARTDLEQALGETTGSDRSRVLSRLAILETRARDTILGNELAELAIAEAGDDPAARGQALAAAAIIDLTLPRFDRARRRFRQARRLLELSGDPQGATRLVYWRSMASFLTGHIARAERELDQLVRLPLTPDELLRLWNPQTLRGYTRLFLCQPRAALTDIDAVLSWARGVDHPVVQCRCLWQRSEALAALGEIDQALDDAESALSIASGVNHAEETAAAWRGIGVAAQAHGDLGRAESAFRRSLAAAESVPLFSGWAAARLGVVLVHQGRLDEAEPMVETAVHHSIPLVRHEGRWAYAELSHARADSRASQLARSALDTACAAGHLALVPRLAELAHGPVRRRVVPCAELAHSSRN
ncbi:BTAD domain-containing putative transcriptional regulator [Nocardia transvalensis]|uniref:BTAD domain-containing putative transcriptional regulator n=1 Tax=Nocardia transvalensis TaxID=37333 RepID=UPI0018949E23|nr:BTAD domain-containing putative transcriptional regulator [Nocardia transvalensis]MBF6334131.1 tetratricopeptide repeat protein [Nocardia transvalensis]